VTIPDSVVAQGAGPLPVPVHKRHQGIVADGLYPQGEGWSIDDVQVKGGVFDVRFFDDMESGMGTWTRSIFPSVGDSLEDRLQSGDAAAVHHEHDEGLAGDQQRQRRSGAAVGR
jgi:hypothetical protein